MSSMVTQIRQAARRLTGSPGYSIGVLVTLALGLALSIGMFTVLNGVLMSALPYPEGDRVVVVGSANAEQNETNGSLTAAEAFALDNVEAFEHAGWFVWGGETVLSGDRPREITINYVSGDYFAALGTRPQLGRWITDDDIGPERQAVVLSDGEWERLANRDPDIIGKTVQLDDQSVTVVGVMPPDFLEGVGLWRAADPGWYSNNNAVFLNARYLSAVARLAPGVDAGRAAAELDTMMAGLRAEHGLEDNGWRLRAIHVLDILVGDVRAVLFGVFVVSLVVLIIACANVGSLLAARLAARERELAIVQALGATSGHVWRGILFELLILGTFAAAAAMALLVTGMQLFRAAAADILPRAEEISLDFTVVGFALALAVLCPLVIAIPFGASLRHRMAKNLCSSGKGTGAEMTRSVRLMPIAGLALATTALIAGTAVALSLDRLRTVDPGFRSEGIYAIQLFHGGGPEEWRRFAGAVIERMSAEADVENVALSTVPPLSTVGSFNVDVQVPGRAEPEPLQAALRRVTPEYNDVLALPLVAGRRFAQTDDAGSPKVAIVNETFARRVFGDVDPVGRNVSLPLGNGPRVNFTVVGVMKDMRNAGLRSAPDPEILVPFMQSPWVGMTFLVHAPRAGDGLLERLQEAVWSVDPTEAMTNVFLLRESLEEQLQQVTFFTHMLAGFALVALLLAGFGTYSVIAFLQRRQVTEVGVRLALGAQPGSLAGRVLAQGVVLALLAGAAGSVAAIAVLRLLGNQLYGVGAASPTLYVLGISGVVLAALLASLMPALRAARVQPMAALRYE